MLLASNIQKQTTGTEDRITFLFIFSPEYLQNAALPSQFVLGRTGTRDEMKKGHPKIFQKVTAKILLRRHILYFKSLILQTVF